jgi:hypothetical protein
VYLVFISCLPGGLLRGYFTLGAIDTMTWQLEPLSSHAGAFVHTMDCCLFQGRVHAEVGMHYNQLLMIAALEFGESLRQTVGVSNLQNIGSERTNEVDDAHSHLLRNGIFYSCNRMSFSFIANVHHTLNACHRCFIGSLLERALVLQIRIGKALQLQEVPAHAIGLAWVGTEGNLLERARLHDDMS